MNTTPEDNGVRIPIAGFPDPSDLDPMTLHQLHDLQARMDNYLDGRLVFDLDDAEFYDAADILDLTGDLEGPVPPAPIEPNYPVGPSYEGECEICFDTCPLNDRLCCGLPVCDNCMERYLETEVNQGNVKIACISASCHVSLYRDEILGRLPDSLKDKYYKFLIGVNKDSKVKTCPRCSNIYSLEKQPSQNRGKYGISVTCPECQLFWCFDCQAPWHSGQKCKDYRKGDKLLKMWAEEHHYGSTNAQRCPKCKIFIQRNGGCDHMRCTKCSTSFCYRCGERYLKFKFFGDHNSRSSIFGCKYIYKPEKPVVRRAVRGSVFGLKLLGGVGLLSLGVVAVGLALGASVFILPGYGAYKILKRRRYLRLMKQEQSFWEMQVHAEYMALQRQKVVHERFLQRHLVEQTSDSGIHVGIQTDQSQQVMVTVHNPDPTNMPVGGATSDPSSEVQIDIQDRNGNVTMTTAEVTHSTVSTDGTEVPVVLHVRTSYKNSETVNGSVDVAVGDDSVEKTSSADTVPDSPNTDTQTTVEAGEDTSVTVGGKPVTVSAHKHFVLCPKSSTDSDKVPKGEKMGSMRKMKKVSQTDEHSSNSSSLLKKTSSKKQDGNGSLSRKKKKFSVSSDTGLHLNIGASEGEGQGDLGTQEGGEEGPKSGEDTSPKEPTHPQGCFLKLFSKNLKTLQHQFDKEKEKQTMLKLASDTKEHTKDLEIHDCPDIVCCAIESEMRRKDSDKSTVVYEDGDKSYKTEDVDLVQGTQGSVTEGTCCTHF